MFNCVIITDCIVRTIKLPRGSFNCVTQEKEIYISTMNVYIYFIFITNGKVYIKIYISNIITIIYIYLICHNWRFSQPKHVCICEEDEIKNILKYSVIIRSLYFNRKHYFLELQLAIRLLGIIMIEL